MTPPSARSPPRVFVQHLRGRRDQSAPPECRSWSDRRNRAFESRGHDRISGVDRDHAKLSQERGVFSEFRETSRHGVLARSWHRGSAARLACRPRRHRLPRSLGYRIGCPRLGGGMRGRRDSWPGAGRRAGASRCCHPDDATALIATVDSQACTLQRARPPGAGLYSGRRRHVGILVAIALGDCDIRDLIESLEKSNRASAPAVAGGQSALAGHTRRNRARSGCRPPRNCAGRCRRHTTYGVSLSSALIFRRMKYSGMLTAPSMRKFWNSLGSRTSSHLPPSATISLASS